MSGTGRHGLAAPPADLSDLPSTRIESEPLWRIHRNGVDPLALASDEHDRFNLSVPQSTLYVATDPLGAFIEVFGRLAILDASEVRSYRITKLEAAGQHLADLTDRSVLGKAGLTAEIHSTTDYELTRSWAEAIAAAGLHGVRYLARHDPASRLTSIALFGGPAAEGPTRVTTEAIGADLLARAEQEFGLLTVPRRVRRR